MNDFTTKDSGERVEFPTGMRRDTAKGKLRYDLIDKDFLNRWAGLMARGAEKYGEDNWRLANTEEELKRFEASAFRHFMQYLEGQTDEDHMVGVAFNLAAMEMVRKKIGWYKSTEEFGRVSSPPSFFDRVLRGKKE